MFFKDISKLKQQVGAIGRGRKRWLINRTLLLLRDRRVYDQDALSGKRRVQAEIQLEFTLFRAGKRLESSLR